MRHVVKIFVILIIFQASILMAQTNTTEEAVNDNIVQYKEAYELLKIIKTGEQERDAEVARIQEGLDKNIKSIDSAQQEFDKMIESVKKAGAMGDPNSDFVKKLEEFALRAEKDAQEAYADGDQEYGDKFKFTSEQFLKAREEAISLYSSTFRDIRAIEEHKRRVVRAIKLSEYTQALKLAQEGLQIIRDVQKQVANVKNSLPVSDEGPVE